MSGDTTPGYRFHTFAFAIETSRLSTARSHEPQSRTSSALRPLATASLALGHLARRARRSFMGAARGVAAHAGDTGRDRGVTRDVLDEHLARRSTRRLIRRVIRARHARAEATLDGWMATVAAHAVSHHFRRGAGDARVP
jgi:hypothetical protein